jgi:hypothetical protein
MGKDRATRQSWKTEPMPDARKLLGPDITLSPEEYEEVQKGHLPDDMDDKWFIYFEDGWLNFHRSWTGNFIYKLRFEPLDTSFRVAEAWVNRDSTQYHRADDEFDARFVRFLIDRVLLDRPVDFPKLP